MDDTSCRRVAILTSGGDAPGMNAAVRAATMALSSQGLDVLGVEDGYRGLLEEAVNPLHIEAVDGIERDGGTILGSARAPEFHEREARETARANLDRLDIDGLMVIGGNGSLTGLHKLLTDPEPAYPAPAAVGIPASIDNDIGLTGHSIGVDSAMNTIVEACDKICDTARAFDRTFLVEVMGRECGYLAMASGIASGAETVLFPESEASEEELVDKIVKAARRAATRQSRPKGALVVKAEGCDIPVERLKELVDKRLDDELTEAMPEIETRVTVLGHVVRGGRPSAFDRLLASRMAYAGIGALASGKSDVMIGWMRPYDFPEDAAERSEVDPYCWTVDLAAVLEETEDLRKGESPLTQWRADIFQQIEDILAQ